jgi:dihydrofolate reductase
MRLALIAAMDRNHVIGKDNDLPWHLPSDLQWFKKNTFGKPILMGRKTYESIGRPLPGRTNIILTRDLDYRAEGCVIVHQLEEAFLAAARHTEDEVEFELVVIGGGQLFDLLIGSADRLYLTLIDAEFDGDVYFPRYNPDDWTVVWQQEKRAGGSSAYDLKFLILDRNMPE